MPSDYNAIRVANIREYGEGTRHLSFLGKLYTDRTHFIFELLQNAEDAGATKISFHLFSDRLEVSHDGRNFDEKDVKGICGVGEGTKAESFTQIGKFGIGFKSVYAYTSTPEIHSGDVHFLIENYVRPYEAQRKSTNGSSTVFIFPFNSEGVSSQCAVKEIGERLTNLNARTLLFLRNITEIEYLLPDSTGGFYLREEMPRGIGRQVKVIGQKGSTEVEANWLIFERWVQVPERQDKVRVEIGFNTTITDTEAKQYERITKINKSPLIVYFPTEKETGLGFLIQGPYRTTPSRDNIPIDDQWNKTLIQETAKLICDILPEIKKLGLLTVSFLEALPIRAEDFPSESMFYPIYEAVLNVLSKDELLPTVDGFFISAQNAVLARGSELRYLLNSGQLGQLFKKSETKIKWLTDDITENRNPDLHSYLTRQLKVVELSPDNFARKIDDSFLSSQSDEWFIKFYKFLTGQQSLWRAPVSNNDLGGILRLKPIIPLESGLLSNPFQQDAVIPIVFLPPNENTTFPIVRKSLIADPEALRFLKSLGLSEPNIYDDIIQNVLPKYQLIKEPVSDSENIEDVKKIFYAIESDSESGKDRVISEAKKTPFLKAINLKECIEYKKPTEIYFNTEDLRKYFVNKGDTWFLDNRYSELSKSDDVWAKLGISNLPRRLSTKIEVPEDLRADHHTIEKVENYNLEGLEQFLQGIQLITDFEKKKGLALVLWVILQKWIKADSHFFKAKYEWFYRSWKPPKYFDSTILNHLKNNEWIPSKNGSFVKPSEITTDQLFDNFIGTTELIENLGIRKASEVERKQNAARELGLNPEDAELIMSNPKELQYFLDSLKPRKGLPAFPERPVQNPERRSEKIQTAIGDAPTKEYKIVERSTKVSSPIIEPRIQLRTLYTNDDEQMVCQICKHEMPFIKRDGTYYFEKKEILSKNYLSKELEAQYLALCPVCAAKYNEFIIDDKVAEADLHQRILDSDDLEIPITLSDEETSIRFVETHFHDLKIIIESEQ